VGSLCECNSGYAESGSSCVPREKNLGCTKSTKSFIHVGNPCNAGTGTKFQAEFVYRGGGTSQLQESLSYNSRLLSEISLVWNGAYGKGWKGNYERQITLYGAVVVMKRADGREIDFRPPSSGNVYVSDDDIADRLERLTDGSGNTTGWKYVVTRHPVCAIG
jgi:hypothetical protein